ncbi:MAG: AraC family transcriptional regulator [Streptosporangiales bacterium]|nr:AraC family transcriptional regulator [Streptosporangiales bacterium]
MAQEFLSRYQLTATTDLDEARVKVAEQFCPHELYLTHRGAHLNLVHNGAPIGENVSLSYMRYGDEVRIIPGTFDDFFLVQIPLSGTSLMRTGGGTVKTDRHRACVDSPTEPVDMLWSDGCEKFVVYMRRQAVEEIALARGEELAPVVFRPDLDLRSPAARSWLRLARLGLDELEAGGDLFRSPITASHFEQTLISGLLDLQPNSAVEVEAPSVPGSPAVRLVLDLIESEPDRPWRVAELAGAAGVSARTLQDAFRRELGITPLEQMRRTRMERARRDLLAADPQAGSVTEIAARWGFFHTGRFSQAYRAAYAELPSETIRRS